MSTAVEKSVYRQKYVYIKNYNQKKPLHRFIPAQQLGLLISIRSTIKIMEFELHFQADNGGSGVLECIPLQRALPLPLVVTVILYIPEGVYPRPVIPDI